MQKIYKIAALVMVLIGVIVLLFMVSDCDKDPIMNKHNEEKKEFQQKIEHYEKAITIDSIIIHNSDRSFRDSIRAVAYLRYMHSDTL